MKKIVDKIFIGFSVLILVVMGIYVCSSIKKGYSNLLGYSLVEVMSESMSASDIHKGDIYVIKDKDSYEVGDIIAFKYDNQIIFHEIINVSENGYQTKGSSNKSPELKLTQTENVLGARCSNKLPSVCRSNVIIVCMLIVYIVCVSMCCMNIFNLYIKYFKTDKTKLLSVVIIFLCMIASTSLLEVKAINDSTLSLSNTMVYSVAEHVSSGFTTNTDGSLSYDNDCGEKVIVIPSLNEYGDEVTEIGSIIIYNDNVETVIIPETVTSIGWFNFWGCDNLKEIIIYNDTQVIEYTSLLGWQINSDAKIYVPDNLYSNYLTTSGWKRYQSQIYMLSER